MKGKGGRFVVSEPAPNLYIAVLVYSTLVEGGYSPQRFSEDIVPIVAGSEEEARSMAERAGRGEQISYRIAGQCSGLQAAGEGPRGRTARPECAPTVSVRPACARPSRRPARAPRRHTVAPGW